MQQPRRPKPVRTPDFGDNLPMEEWDEECIPVEGPQLGAKASRGQKRRRNHAPGSESYTQKVRTDSKLKKNVFLVVS